MTAPRIFAAAMLVWCIAMNMRQGRLEGSVEGLGATMREDIVRRLGEYNRVSGQVRDFNVQMHMLTLLAVRCPLLSRAESEKIVARVRRKFTGRLLTQEFAFDMVAAVGAERCRP